MEVGAYIDVSIADTGLREIDWNITVYTLVEQWPLVLFHKWRRLVYLQSGSLLSNRRMLQANDGIGGPR